MKSLGNELKSENMNSELNPFLTDFILNNFFKNEKYAGWYNIATKLLKDGKCIVAGEGEHIFTKMAVSKFIKTSKSDIGIGCQLYEFDLKAFLNSDEFNEIHKREISKMEKQLIEVRDVIANLQLSNQISTNRPYGLSGVSGSFI